MEPFHSLSSPTFPAAHLVISLENGGLENLVMRWTAYRNRHLRNSTHIICLDRPGALAHGFQGGSIHCVNAKRSKFPWDRQAVKRLSRLLLDLNIAVIHSHDTAANQYAVLAAHPINIPNLHTQHGKISLGDKGIKSIIRNRILSRFTGQYVAVSEEITRDISRTHGIPLEKVEFIANGVENKVSVSEEQIQQLRQNYNIPRKAFILGSVGRLESVKGWDMFLPVFAQLTRECVNKKPLHLLLVGDGSEQKHLRNMAEQLNIADKVTFAGFQKNCIPFFRMMDLFVMPSRSEGLSVSLLEAMLVGCPVAVTAVGEHTKLLETSCGGELLTPNKPESWPGILLDLLYNDEKRILHAKNGQTHIETNFTLKRTVQAYEDLYRDLIETFNPTHIRV